MEQKHITCGSVCDRSVNYPWLVAQKLEGDTKDLIFFTMHDPISHYRCRIPELLERRIRGFFHGWVILSNHPHNVMWSLWNPITSKIIRLPPLTLKDRDFESIKHCCLSSPPDDPTSVLMLTRTKAPTIVFCRLDCKRKRLKWKEMTYAKQLSSITGHNGVLHCLTCCNDKVYALSSGGRGDHIVIQVDIVVKDKEVVISLLAFGKVPLPFDNGCSSMKLFLRGYCNDLFFIQLGFDDTALVAVYLFKLDTTKMIWEEMGDFEDAIFFLDLAHDCSIFYRDAIASELGGYMHVRGKTGKVIYSYNVNDKTISLSSINKQSTHLSLWECWLNDDHKEFECGTGFKPNDEIMARPVRNDEVDTNNSRNEETHLLSIPLDVLRMITEFCIGVEYLNLRATCKHCQLGAPMNRWSNETSLRRLQTYSFNSPLLAVLDKHRGIITFTDPMFGDKYFIKMPQELIGDLRICCSRYGWLLLYKLNGPKKLFFFNPFTKDCRELPNAPYLDRLYLLAPPTSPDCMVVGLSTSLPGSIFIHSVTKKSTWARFRMDFMGTTPHSLLFLTIFRQCMFALNQGVLSFVLRNAETNSYWNTLVVEAPRGRSSSQYYLANCIQYLLLVVMDELGEFVEVLKLNVYTKEWEKVDSLGSHMIYICGNTCICMEAKTLEMENKIYFRRLDSKNGKIVFYSLETRMYHTFNGRNIEQSLENFFGTKYHVYPHTWIEPSWS